MSNYYNEYYEQNNYTNTYSLWENSRYYDINNLSPHNRNSNVYVEALNSDFRATKWPESSGDEAASPPDPRNRRIIERESLYEDPESFYKDETGTPKYGKASIPSWTEQFWQKSSDKHSASEQGPSQINNPSTINTCKPDSSTNFMPTGTNLQQPGNIEPPDTLSGTNVMQIGTYVMQSGTIIPAGTILKQSGGNNGRMGGNYFQKDLENEMARPVKMAKAESMMEKMGWHGGALGRTGNGIVEPVTPNAIYTKTRIGFGQTQAPKPPAPKSKRVDCKKYFDMNALLHIYEFVKNNSEIELMFDRTLWKDERKRIHYLVQELLNAEDLAMVNFSSNAQMDLVLQICDKNCYILCTQSDGEPPNRRLCIYKEAPLHVYLIIPDDLRYEEKDEATLNNREPIETTQESTENDIKSTDSDAEVEEESNPFLRSITRNLKKQKTDSESDKTGNKLPESEKMGKNLPDPEKMGKNLVKSQKTDSKNTQSEKAATKDTKANTLVSKISDKIIEYFTEFSEKKQFTQFKFLGPFSGDEVAAINNFIEDASNYLNGDKKEHPVFGKLNFKIDEDCSGNTVIMKRPV